MLHGNKPDIEGTGGQTDGQTVSKQEIVKQLFGSITLSGQGRLDVLLTRLRKKCRTELGEEIPIQTAHSTGYNFGAPAKILES